MPFGAFIRKKREEKGIQMNDFARQLEISPAYWSRIERDMDPFVAARQMDTDEIIELGELRGYLSALVEMSYQNTGSRRIKNPRIWSMHDLGVLVGGVR